LTHLDQESLAVTVAAVVAVYLVGIVGLVLAGRRQHAEAFARFVPDCAVLFGRLGRDPRVARRHKVMLLGVAAYLAMPLDLVPDFIPIAGQLDDAIMVALALRTLFRAGDELLVEHWPGPPSSLAVLKHLGGARR
jgi:uncharacterized membrane protein YkvA (DUF1232 family)